jgi:N-acetyl-gamma-glutamyl-phosphate reductase
MAAKVFIDGEAGTTGLQIRERLSQKCFAGAIELVSLDEHSRKDETARLDAMRAADLAVLCLPDDAAREAVAMADRLGEAAPKLLDASTAHRVAPGWVFGFPELGRGQAEEIAASFRVANPGCYATGAIALLRPLVDAGMLSPEQDVTINAVSGYSGGGKTMIAAHEAKGGPAFELYSLTLTHKHVPEIMRHGGLSRRPIFVPSVGHFRQGMLVSIPLFLDRLPGEPSAYEIAEAYYERYNHTARIRAYPGIFSGDLDPQILNDTDRMEIFVCAKGNHVVLVARLDNLGKGAAGAAVQNLGLMLGLPDAAETEEELTDA